MTTTDVIAASGLRKTFGKITALDGLDLDVTPGEIHGFLGPNGAGKSTTIRILLGLMRKTAGDVTVFGQDPWNKPEEIHGRLAYVPGDVTLWSGLTGGQCVDVLAQAHGGIRPERRAELLERFDLDPSRRARDYSKGNRQKVALVAALAADVDLFILDEPTSGLDPLMEQTFQDVVRERRAEGATVLLSSHILGEVEALADRVSIVRKGRIVTSGTLADLRRHTRTSVHAVTTQAPAQLDSMPGVTELKSEPQHDRFDTRFHVEPADLDTAIGVLHAAGIHTMTASPPSLDDLFLSAYDGELVR